jgi:NitT/TauT family transport system substrate-binding protein
MTKRRALLVGVGGVLVAILAAIYLYNGTKAPSSYRIAIATWPGFAISYVAKEKELFEDMPADIKIIDDPTARLTAFRTGQVDVMISSLDVFSQESADGIDGKIFMVTDASSGADGVVARPEIKTTADLVGKSVAVAKGSPSHFFLHALLKQSGSDLKGMKLVFFDDPTLAGQAFATGKVDAAVTWEPLLSEIIDKGQGHLLATSADTPNTIIDVLVGSTTFLADRNRVQKFIDAWLRGIEITKSDPSGAAVIVAKALGMAPPVSAEKVFFGLTLADRSANEQVLCPTSSKPALADAVLEEAQAFWIEERIIRSVKRRPAQLIDRIMCK